MKVEFDLVEVGQMTSSIESVGPIDRRTGSDPDLTLTWPIAVALALLRAIARDFAVEERRQLMQQAYIHDARAFPVGDPPLEEGRRLLDFAGAHPDQLKLYYSGGIIEAQYLGPDAQVLPMVGTSGAFDLGRSR